MLDETSREPMSCRPPPTLAGLLILGIFTAMPGCSTRVIPPPHPKDPVAVFIADYGRHSSLVLPDDHGGLTEYAFGDWDWFALNRNTLLDGFHALFASDRSALGRRKLHGPASRPVIEEELNVKQVAELTAARARVNALLEQLDSQYQRHTDTRLFNQADQMWFVQDDEHYTLFNNCNHVTARWLEALECRVSGSGFSADFRVEGDHLPVAHATAP